MKLSEGSGHDADPMRNPLCEPDGGGVEDVAAGGGDRARAFPGSDVGDDQAAGLAAAGLAAAVLAQDPGREPTRGADPALVEHQIRLSLESRSQQGGEGVALVARLLGDVLDGPDREAFLVDFVQTARAAAEVGVLAPLVAVLADWKATAAIYADPALAADLHRPLPGDGDPVPTPSAR
ncbi:MAG: hypothetical protein ACYDC5_01310 [Candidatus Dormibacteria bacterium]